MKEQNSKCYPTQSQGKVPRFPLQCVTFSLLLALLVLLGVAGFVLASDVSDAGYRGRITVANNGTANTSIATVFTLNTQSLIDTNKLNSSANDCAIQVAAGTDTAFMPSVNSTYPWATWVPTIGEDETLYQYLYTSGVTGGKIRYFPGTGGMTTADSASLELGDNFTKEQIVQVDVTAVGANLTTKQGAFRTYVSASGNITSVIYDEASPTGHSDPDTEWNNETNAYDDDTGTFANDSVGGMDWTAPLILTQAATICDGVRIWADVPDQTTEEINVDAYYNGAWHDIYDGTFNDLAWVSYSLDDVYSVTQVRIYLKNNVGVGKVCRVHEADFFNMNQNITASGLSSGELTIRVWADTSDFHISIGGVESDNMSLAGASVPNNSSSWYSMQGIDYMERNRTWIDGVLQQDISWEYTAGDFADQSGNNHDATPTFRTTSSDPNVSANLTSFTGIMETTPPPAAGQTGWDILPSVPASPGGFFEEFDPSSMTFWGSGYISTFSTATSIPLALIVFPYAFGIAIGAGFIAWYLSSGGGKQHNRGSLLAMAATSLIFMLYFVYGAGGVIPGWILLPFAIEVLVFIVWRQTPSPF